MMNIFDRTLADYVSETSQDDRIEGILVTGSYARDEVGPYSDLDICVLVVDECMDLPAWEAVTRNGVEIEIVRNTFQGYQDTLLEKREIRQVIVPLAEGRVIFDRNSRLARIKEQAQAIVDALSERVLPDDEMKANIARPLTFGYRKLANAYYRKDWLAFDLEYGFVLHLLLPQMLLLAGRQVAPRQMLVLREICPDLFRLLCSCFEGRTYEEKWTSFHQLMERVFAEFGLGNLPTAFGANNCID